MKRLSLNHRWSSSADIIWLAIIYILAFASEGTAQTARRTTQRADAVSIEQAFRKAERLKLEKKYAQAIAILNSLESKINNPGCLQFRLVILSRADCWYALHKEQRWRHEIEILLPLYQHRAAALSKKAYYLSMTQDPRALEECRTTLGQIDKTKLSGTEGYLVLATEYLVARREKNSAAQLRAALAMNKLIPNAHTLRVVATALASNGKFEASRATFERAAKLSDNPAQQYLIGARVLLASDDLAGASELAKEAWQLNRGSADLAFFCADLNRILAQRGLTAQPTKPFLEAIDDNRCTLKQQQEKYMRLANEEISHRRFSQAETYAKKAEQIMNSPEACELLGKINWECTNYKQSACWYGKAVTKEPKLENAWLHLGLCHARLGNTEEAIKLCNAALSVNPRNVPALRTRAALFLVNNKVAAANDDVQRLQKLEPNKNHSLDSIRILGAKYTMKPLQYYKAAGDGWKEHDRLKLAGLEKQIKQTNDKNLKASLLQEQARLEAFAGQYAQAYEHTQASIALGNPTYQIHSLAAAALHGLKREDEAKVERQLAVTVHHAQHSPHNNQQERDERDKETKSTTE